MQTSDEKNIVSCVILVNSRDFTIFSLLQQFQTGVKVVESRVVFAGLDQSNA